MKQIKKILGRLRQTTRTQRIIFWILCIIVNTRVLLYLTKLVVNGESQELLTIMLYSLIVGIELVLVLIPILVMIYCILSFLINKLEKIEEKKIYKRCKEKLRDEEFTEIFFTSEGSAPQGSAGEFYWDIKHCTEPQLFARWQEDEKIYIVLKDGDEKVRDWTIGKLSFFDFWFKFSK